MNHVQNDIPNNKLKNEDYIYLSKTLELNSSNNVSTAEESEPNFVSDDFVSDDTPCDQWHSDDFLDFLDSEEEGEENIRVEIQKFHTQRLLDNCLKIRNA